MVIGLDLTWMSDTNGSGGAFHYALRLTHALVIHSDEFVVALVNPYLSDLFSELQIHHNFKVVTIHSPDDFNFIIRRENVEVIHRPVQEFDNVTLSVPMINSLHDLQQFHYPDFFEKSVLDYRETYYRGAAEFSERIIVSYQHVKEDIVKYYGIHPGKIDVCPVGLIEPKPINLEHASTVKQKYGLPDRYLFYPAAAWRHKNHLGLIKALSFMRDHYGVTIPLICTGYQCPDFFPEIERAVAELQMESSVRFLGYVPDGDLPVILTKATLVVIPTLYEAGSYPLFEAMAYRTPVICSNVTSLPETIGDSRFIFDPTKTESIADLVVSMLNSPQLINANIQNSSSKLKTGGWETAVKPFLISYKNAIESFNNRKSRVYIDKIINSYEAQKIQKHAQCQCTSGFPNSKTVALDRLVHQAGSYVKKLFKRSFIV